MFVNDHLQNFPYSNMPAFCVGLADAYDAPSPGGARLMRLPPRRLRGQPEWGMALLQMKQDLFDGSAYHLPVSSWGDIGAASGALFVTLAARAWARGYARGPLALAWAGSESGLRTAVVLRQPRSE